MTQAALAKMLGMSQTGYSKYETGENDVPTQILIKLADFYGTSVDYLWGDRIFEKCGIRREEEGDGGKTLEIRGKRRLSARDGGANYQQS